MFKIESNFTVNHYFGTEYSYLMAAKESQGDVSNEKRENFNDIPPPYSGTVNSAEKYS